MRTENGGNSWSVNYVGASTFYSVFFVSESTGWIVCDNNSVKKTTNGGISWIDQDFNSSVNYSFRDVHFVNATQGWVAGQGILEGIILRTSNAGDSWNYFPGGPFFNSLTMISAHEGSTVGEYGLIMETTDGGASWYPQHDFGEMDLYSIYYRDEVTGWITGENGFIAKTLNNGENWTIQNSGTSSNLNSLTFHNEYGWIVGDAGTILHTIDDKGGYILQGWELVYQVENQSFYDIQFLDAYTGYCRGYTELFKSTDSGISWSGIIMPERIADFNFVDKNLGYALCRYDNNSRNIILKTINGGESWTEDSVQSIGYPLRKIQLVSDSIGYAVGGTGIVGGILKLSGANSSYWEIIHSVSDNCQDLFFLDKNIGWVVTSKGHLLKTSNGGNTWIEYDNLGSGYLTQDIYFVNDNVGFLGREYWDGYWYFGEILKTTDGGVTWEYQSAFDRVRDIFMIDENFGWYAGVWGSLMYTRNGGENWERYDSETEITYLSFLNENL
ncbi:MAG: hypothetical protein JSW63_11905 [Ignavibacterium sp.]|nr:MAG: hypothetical protein JSW63_11905 [Ignavibacterium sp.]